MQASQASGSSTPGTATSGRAGSTGRVVVNFSVTERGDKKWGGLIFLAYLQNDQLNRKFICTVSIYIYIIIYTYM